ncbi:hypothetical protein QTP86_029123 [Hemibagrus guttatus]|nr:hypothetical protein QTP86_029123 [Hemibagrus guttatus]
MTLNQKTLPKSRGLPYTLFFLKTRDLADTHYTMERRDRRAHGFGIAGRRPLRRSLRRCFESARLLRFVAELSRFLSDVSDNLPALAEASPLQSGPDDAPDPDAVPDMPDPEDVPNPDDEPDLADEPEPDALNLAGRPSPSPPPSSSPSSTTCPVVTTVVSMARAVRKGFKESYVDRCGPLGVLLCTKYSETAP